MANVQSRGRGPGTSNIKVSTLVAQSGAPSAATDKAQIYALNDSGTIEIYVMDSAGNPTKLSG